MSGLKAKLGERVFIVTALLLIWADLVISSSMVAIIGLDTVAALYIKDAAQAARLHGSLSARSRTV